MVLYSMYVCMYKSYLKKCFRVFFLLFYKKNPKNFSLLFICDHGKATHFVFDGVVKCFHLFGYLKKIVKNL